MENKNKGLLAWGPKDPLKPINNDDNNNSQSETPKPVEKKKKGKKNYATFYLKEETIDFIERAVFWEGKKLKAFTKGELIDLLVKHLQETKKYEEIPKEDQERKLF
jgi:hypothetical protein